MTQEPTPPPAPVTAVDREAAAYLHDCIWGTDAPETQEGHARLLSGERDAEFMVQTLVLHRMHARAKAFEEAERACHIACFTIGALPGSSINSALQEAATAIRALADSKPIEGE